MIKNDKPFRMLCMYDKLSKGKYYTKVRRQIIFG